MRNGYRLLPLAFVIIVALGVDGRASAQSRETGDPPGQWVELGPDGWQSSQSVAISPDWPSDPFIAALRYDGLALSHNGGQTWRFESIPVQISGRDPSERLSNLTVAPLHHGEHILFGLAEHRVLRSIDEGRTWSDVLLRSPRSTLSGQGPSRDILGQRILALSPQFADDGFAMVTADDHLYTSSDAGMSWRRVDPLPGQQIWQASLSPAFGTDRTIVVAAVAGGFPNASQAPYDTDPNRALRNERSAGVVISEDGGESWRVTSRGLELDGVPCRHVHIIVMSPTFAQDGMLFAFAWGPEPPGAVAPSPVPVAIFRSTDRAESWAPVWRRDPPSPETRRPMAYGRDYGLLRLPMDFAASGTGRMSLPNVSGSPSGGACEVLVMESYGRDWSELERRGSEVPCPIWRQFGTSDGLVSYKVQTGTAPTWQRSFGTEGRWERVAPPGIIQPSQYTSATFASDGTIIQAGEQGIWALGPSARAMEGGRP